jgi:hypothetical protein
MGKTIDMAREAGACDIASHGWTSWVGTQSTEFLKRFEALVRADEQKKWQEQTAVEIHEAILDEREACAKVCEEFARKWWKIHCDSNLHYSSTLKAHQDFCALQVAIRARGNI